MSRLEKLKSIRPKIPTIIEEANTTTTERFQNQVLRPILKFQNNLLLEIFKQYIGKRKGVFHQLPHDKKAQYIAHSVQKDQRFRHFLTGVVCGHFTVPEWTLYQSEESEFNKRILQMIIQRLQSQIEELKL